MPPVAATLGFVYLLNPSTGPVNVILGWLGIEGPLWFNDPGWSKPSLVMLGLWGVGTTMIIFLAAILDVPQHLYESAELDGAGALQRLRYVTLPTISPVILFAVVLGVIASLQYFTQAHVAASVAAGSAVQGGSTSNIEIGYPEGSTLFYPILVYNHGFRYFNMGYASAMAMLLLVVAFAVTAVIIWNSRRVVHYQGIGAMTAVAHAEPATARRTVPRSIRRRRLLVAIADHSLLIAAAIAFVAPVVFVVLTSLMTNRQALSADIWPQPFRFENFLDVFRDAPLWRWAMNSFIYAGLATLGLLLSSIPVAYAFACLRWRGRDAVFMVVLVALMLPPQVTVVPLYIMWAKLDLGRRPLAVDHPQLVRRRIRDLPAPPVLPDDPRASTSTPRGSTAAASSAC